MTEKIDWYREILELEPNSKVFFPLARLLADAGKDKEAIQELERGLERHSDFLEARLFLIELLYKNGGQAACASQVEKLSKMFASYAGFWQAWAACLGGVNGEADTASALRFLAANFLHGPISLHDVLNLGLKSLLQNNSQDDAQGVGVKGAEEAISSATMQAEAASAAPDSAAFASQDALDDIPADLDLLSDMPASNAQLSNEDAASAPEDEEESEEPFSLRTRSMAEVLAEQGDIAGALDIYHELAAAATGDVESADLKQRIATLSLRLQNESAPQKEPAPEADTGIASGGSKDKLISMLEALAERVEARAQS